MRSASTLTCGGKKFMPRQSNRRELEDLESEGGVVMDRCVNLHEAELDPLPLEENDILAGRPAAAVKALGEFSGTEFGVWSLTSGTVRDVEVDEVFVVLEGDATVRFETGESIELTPGVFVRLHAGERTEWEVRSLLRKLYVAAG
ncbi:MULTISPECIES: cupin domain-containing protein [Streptomyces]|uniref:Cupin domain-containing protein n=2 Tax=Streptomyces TaxID=1883 RepID=A0ABV9J970_9ACTN